MTPPGATEVFFRADDVTALTAPLCAVVSLFLDEKLPVNYRR